MQFSSSSRMMIEQMQKDVYTVESPSIHFLLIVFLCSLLPQMAYVLKGSSPSSGQRWPKIGLNQSATPICSPDTVYQERSYDLV